MNRRQKSNKQKAEAALSGVNTALSKMVIENRGPWIAKEVTKGVFAYCPNFRAFPQTKFGSQDRGTIACACHNSTAQIVEFKSPLPEPTS